MPRANLLILQVSVFELFPLRKKTSGVFSGLFMNTKIPQKLKKFILSSYHLSLVVFTFQCSALFFLKVQ